jgi:hypothetical protein
MKFVIRKIYHLIRIERCVYGQLFYLKSFRGPNICLSFSDFGIQIIVSSMASYVDLVNTINAVDFSLFVVV